MIHRWDKKGNKFPKTCKNCYCIKKIVYKAEEILGNIIAKSFVVYELNGKLHNKNPKCVKLVVPETTEKRRRGGDIYKIKSKPLTDKFRGFY